MFTNAEIVKSEMIHGQLYLTIKGIFDVIQDVSAIDVTYWFIAITKIRKNLANMILLNNTGLYESVKGMYDEEFEGEIMDVAINHVYLKKIA